jgi:hypothetical protein
MSRLFCGTKKMVEAIGCARRYTRYIRNLQRISNLYSSLFMLYW